MRDVTSVVRSPCEDRPKHRSNSGRNSFIQPSIVDHRVYNSRPDGHGGPLYNLENGLNYSYPANNDTGGVNYLSPPVEIGASWRRTASDSALNAQHDPTLSPGAQRRCYDDSSGCVSPMLPLYTSLISTSTDFRKTYYDVPGSDNCPLIQGVSPNGSSLQIPIGHNTGSLPDLTNIHQSSSPIPIMVERDKAHSPYSTSPRLIPSPSMSPRRLAPYHHRHSPGGSPSRGSSPGPAPRRRHNQHVAAEEVSINFQELVLHRSRLERFSPQPHQSPNHLSVPGFHTSVQPDSQCLTAENSPQLGTNIPFTFPVNIDDQTVRTVTAEQVTIPHRSPPEYVRQHSVHVSPAQSPTTNHPSSSQHYHVPQRRVTHPYTANQLNWYPNTLNIPNSKNYRSTSPGDNSAPPSPLSQSLSPASSPGLAASPSSPFSDNGQQGGGSNGSNSDSGIGGKNLNPGYTDVLHQHFENFNMNELPGDSTINCGFNPLQVPGQSNSSLGPGLDMVLDQNFGLPSFAQFDQPLGRLSMTTAPQTPQTPSSIPDINVQDCSVDFGHEIQPDNGFGPDLSTLDNLESLLNGTDGSDFSNIVAASVTGFY